MSAARRNWGPRWRSDEAGQLKRPILLFPVKPLGSFLQSSVVATQSLIQTKGISVSAHVQLIRYVPLTIDIPLTPYVPSFSALSRWCYHRFRQTKATSEDAYSHNDTTCCASWNYDLLPRWDSNREEWARIGKLDHFANHFNDIFTRIIMFSCIHGGESVCICIYEDWSILPLTATWYLTLNISIRICLAKV